MKNVYLFILLTVLAAVVVGCKTADLPPGFSRVGGVLQTQTSHAASPEAVFSLMTWYEETNAGLNPPRSWSEAVANAKANALNDLHEQWKAALIRVGTPLLQNDMEHFVTASPKLLANRTDWDKLDAIVRNTKALLLTEHQITVPFEECQNDAFWSPKSRYGKTAFVTWSQNRKLVVPDSQKLDRQALIAQIKAVETDIVLKKSILEALRKTEQLNKADGQEEALALLAKTIRELPEKPLSTIGDETTLPLLSKRYAEQPVICINHAIAKADEQLKALASKQNAPNFRQLLTAAELSMSNALKKWHADERFKNALNLSAGKLRETTAKMCDLRLASCQKEMTDLAKQADFWGAALVYQAAVRELDIKADADFALYTLVKDHDGATPFAQGLRQNLQKHLKSILPDAAEYLLAIAEKSADIGQRHGQAVALCIMLQTIISMADATDESAFADIVKKADDLCKKSTRVIMEKQLAQTVSIKDMESGQPGLGLTYTRDVTNALQALIIAFGLDKTVVIAEPGTPLTPLGYVLHNGVVADYDGSATTERQAFRTARRWGEVKRMANPEFQKDSQQPKDIFTQEVIEQLVHIREIERQAHIRVFISVRGPGFTTTVDVNEFYPKRFIVEESHPFNDIKVADVVTVYDLDKLKVPDALPPLKQDRIWTTAEMLDWARKDSLQIFALKLLYHINQFPNYLATRADRFAKDGALADAVEQWAYCHVLCSLHNFDEDPATLIKSDVPPVAASYETTITALRKQRSELAELKRNAVGAMLAKAHELLKQAQHPAK
ncbi:MAG: hypothetical protein IKS92_16550 [Victivallales bacterium]|nr:hypothetical protein [Victivallales bacterium]